MRFGAIDGPPVAAQRAGGLRGTSSPLDRSAIWPPRRVRPSGRLGHCGFSHSFLPHFRPSQEVRHPPKRVIRHVLGLLLNRYLTEWRMHLAEDLLATSDAGVATVAGRVGYDSEESFSRAFKRERGISPSHWRAARSAPSSATAP
jgi:Helix-turn-helix domain